MEAGYGSFQIKLLRVSSCDIGSTPYWSAETCRRSFKDLPVEPVPIDAMPLIRLMMKAETFQVEAEMIRVIAGPMVH